MIRFGGGRRRCGVLTFGVGEPAHEPREPWIVDAHYDDEHRQRQQEVDGFEILAQQGDHAQMFDVVRNPGLGERHEIQSWREFGDRPFETGSCRSRRQNSATSDRSPPVSCARRSRSSAVGRVGSTSLFIVAGGNCVGALLGGAVASEFGLTTRTGRVSRSSSQRSPGECSTVPFVSAAYAEKRSVSR
ncbi:hypothetical protein [Amycolatopsis sp. cmx-11-12]|uniref:hypothetical protein n=1 Tax=Amycolatopsis sp. cmx-11-12 TaxID=2785795 RepID=UPI003917EC48